MAMVAGVEEVLAMVLENERRKQKE